MEITIKINEKNPFNQNKKVKQIQILASLDCQVLEKIVQLSKLDTISLDKLVQLKNSPNGVKMLNENWDIIEEMSK